MSKSTPALLSAIAGYRGEHAGSKDHEDIMQQLERIEADVARGKASEIDSPGRREAKSAANREMSSERGHPGGDGQVDSNEPGPEAPEAKTPPDIGPSNGRDSRMSGTGPVASTGQATSNRGGPSAPSGARAIRQLAAERALSDGNKLSNLKGPPAVSTARGGEVPAPARVPTDDNRKVSSEATPTRMGKDNVGSGFEGAKVALRNRLKSGR